MLDALFESSRTTKRIISLVYDTIAIVTAFYLAVFLRLGTLNSPFFDKEYIVLPITLAVSLAVFIKLGMYRAILRYMSTPAMLTIVACVCISSIVLALSSFFAGSKLPRSVPVIYLTIALVLIGSPRLLVRSIVMLLSRQGNIRKEPVIVYGAGYTGHQLTLALQGTAYRVAAFVDDKPNLQGNSLANIKIHPPSMLETLVRTHGAYKVLLALGSTPNSRRSQVIKRLEALPVSVQTVPAIPDILSGKARIEHIKDVEIDDLLGRDPVQPNPELLNACITDKVVMVTGAGGSIGSELCRQIIQQAPKVLVLFELNEFSLYTIEQELQQLLCASNHHTKLVSILGSVQKEHRVETIMRSFGVQTVYHAAAYKHVPLVEHNIVEGVRNNLYGTWYCAEAAIRAGVESFVLISTDKAVRPTNIMGASKRMAELALQGLAQRQSGTRFTMVRFGNVLGSSGSVVSLFRQQIKAGGPVTVTHPDIIRYFMTITEAAELVIQAGAMGTGGDVFVLDMGEPVKIVDLAKRMIHLSGLKVRSEKNPNGDISIDYTGLRPGEKLFEELLIGDTVAGTQHPRIMRAEEHSLTWEETKLMLDEMDVACHNYKCDLVQELLTKAPTGYHKGQIEDLVWSQKRRDSAKLRVIN
ncbi:nucleoside-diphosphate sugar epimerase/dehydratase [Marinimicrobium sp. ABcell2]|uniref:polysaccharide biosynthesis protein n=1 Tax=Marinimicrobium sp. ABcell2 TaxID=3069751 RepID=UPI0027B03A1E|nr:nucleoside-diphosphate sugar epimerase/dehydratase [Marinimicrobium sp. ABcell2]MDQ2078350.1 nucleoside-diphosphate sugar epimerase/dehydratase [Marinimicrobium sp. ABcell2]